MNPMRLVILLAVMWISGSLLFAQERIAPVDVTRLTQAAESDIPDAPSRVLDEPAAEDANPASANEPAAAVGEPVPDQDASEDKDPEASSDTRASAADRGSSPQRFVPSEKVRADFDVSFPIDI